ncbi:hypothetical protein VKT23_016558 [Stygiomarasmius scandens]|uniref:Uncharacterized protein n=1 Tax=Marasmiellus scandens TaxID=2682957 RepID=A0ABR1IW91_9AGAR
MTGQFVGILEIGAVTYMHDLSLPYPVADALTFQRHAAIWVFEVEGTGVRGTGIREEEVWLEEPGDYSVENTVGIGGPSRVTLVHDAKTQQVQHQNQDKQSSGDNATLPTGAGFTRTTWSSHSSTLTLHHFNPNGLLEVNPLSPTHPILTLIEQAQQEWAEKHARASTTLESAVVEYERRYNRPPPRGFDKWWGYVEKHEVLLPDEYDQIYSDLEHYWGVDPHVLISQTYERETRTAQGYVEDRYTIGKAIWKTPIHMVNWSLPSAAEDEERVGLNGRWKVDCRYVGRQERRVG